MKEIDIRALMMGNLISRVDTKGCYEFTDVEEVFGQNIIVRNFNSRVTWNYEKQVNFIESVFMGCEIPLMVFFEISGTSEKYILVDGLNRFITLRKFLHDELLLGSRAIQKLKFLENKKISNLSLEERNYFLNRSLYCLIYSYPQKVLLEEEIDVLAKQLYIRYNSGIPLKKEEIQKADFQEDWVTNKIAEKLQDQDFLNKLQRLSITPKNNIKTYIEKTLMTCRWLITSTYAPLEAFAKSRSDFKAIDDYYVNYTSKVPKEQILEEFCEIIHCLYGLTNQDYWDNYPELHNKYFTMITYWMFFNLIKHKLIHLNTFDWNKYLKAYYEMEAKNNFKRIYWGFYQKFQFVISFLQQEYHIDLSSYIIQIKEIENQNLIYDFADFPTFNFQFNRENYDIAAFMKILASEYIVLRPPYQRHESTDKKAASFLIESSILGVQIPSILLYKHRENGKTVFEVVDGQQRCFSYLAFLNLSYHNIYGEDVISEKQGFSLTGLNVLSDLNGKRLGTTKTSCLLDSYYLEKLKKGKIRVVVIPEDKNPYFSVRDYFTRVNKTINPLRLTSCVYWNAFFDKQIMDFANLIAKKFKKTLLPKTDKEYKATQYVLNLAYFFYYNQTEVKHFSLKSVFIWLNKFEIQKMEFFNHNQEDQIASNRERYLLALKNTEAFLGKIAQFLNCIKKDYSELINNHQRPFTPLRALYYMIFDIHESDLLQHAESIYNIIYQFFHNNDIKGLRADEEIKSLNATCAQLSIYHKRTAQQRAFTERLQKMI